MTTWTSDALDKLGRAQEVQIASRRDDDTLGGWRTIWVVRDGEDLYVRSMNGPTAAWYHATRARHEGRIRTGGMEQDVVYIDADPGSKDRVDAAYRAKYGRYSASIIDVMTSPQASATTMRLQPRP